jgi:hypothetical protein
MGISLAASTIRPLAGLLRCFNDLRAQFTILTPIWLPAFTLV